MQTALVVFDLFPAVMETPFGRLDQVRVVATSTDGAAFVLSGDGPMMVAKWGIVDTVEEKPGVWLWTDPDGETWRAIRAGGCGCGNPMKRYAASALVDAAGI